MRGFRLYLFLLSLCGLLLGCGRTEEQLSVQARLDSLVGSLATLERLLLPADSALVQQCLNDFNKRRGITASLSGDTLTATDASALESFYRSAQQLEAGLSNRSLLKGRTTLLLDQLMDLRTDAGTKAYSPAQLQQHAKREWDACESLTRMFLDQEKMREQAIKDFIESRNLVDQLLQRRAEKQAAAAQPKKRIR